ncbi:hypothetical protein ACLK19_22750 [Escherichia coli]
MQENYKIWWSMTTCACARCWNVISPTRLPGLSVANAEQMDCLLTCESFHYGTGFDVTW